MLEELCASIVDRHQVAVDACIHAPHTGSGSDERNYHAHILMSTRKLTPEGFTEKTRELDQKHSGEIEHWREHFADICNMHLDLAGYTARVDHRSYKDQENGLEATLHEGPKVTELRRRGIETEISRTNDEIKERNQAQLQYGKNMDLLIAENEIKLSALKTEQQTQIENSAKTPPIDEKALFEEKQRETLGKVLKREISAKEANLDLDFMQDVFKKAENTLGKMQQHKNEFSQQLAQDIVKSGLKQSHDKLQRQFQIPGRLSSFFGFLVVPLRSRVFPGFLNVLVRLRVNKFLYIPHQFFGCSHVLGLHVHNRSFHRPDRQLQQ